MKLSLDKARAALSRVGALPWARPLSRLALGVAVLLVLVIVGRATFAGARPALAHDGDGPASSEAPPPPAPSAALPLAAPAAEAEPPALPAPTAHGPATPDDPVVLNDATVDDLQRLPGVGQKRAMAILDLRTRLGRFHQVEDLLKVKGIGLKTLRRLRPLVRLDRPPRPDAGAAPPAS